MKVIREIMSEREFYDLLIEKGVVLVVFYANWCKACKMQTPIINDFHLDTIKKVEIVSVDVDLLPRLADEYGVCVIPSTALFVNGKMVCKRGGLASKGNLAEMVIKYV